MQIRLLREDDINAALALVWRVFCEFEAPGYSEEGINEFKLFIKYSTFIEKLNAGTIIAWGCFENEILLGVIAIRDTNHICLLFVEKAYHRKGIAKQLFMAVKKHCENLGAKKITVYSSPYALEAYRHIGFIDTGSEQTVKGIRFIPMEFLLE